MDVKASMLWQEVLDQPGRVLHQGMDVKASMLWQEVLDQPGLVGDVKEPISQSAPNHSLLLLEGYKPVKDSCVRICSPQSDCQVGGGQRGGEGGLRVQGGGDLGHRVGGDL